jgi:hypothetical protein
MDHRSPAPEDQSRHRRELEPLRRQENDVIFGRGGKSNLERGLAEGRGQNIPDRRLPGERSLSNGK